MHHSTIDVLLVDDNPGDVRLVREMVRAAPELRIHHVDRLSAGIARVAAEKFDVVLLDLGLPDSQGAETLRAFIRTGCTVPVVVLTGQDDEAMGQEAVREGAQDYLVKGRVEEHGLTQAVRYAIERNESQAKLRHLNRVLRAIRNVNQLIVRERDPQALVDEACHLLVDTRGYDTAWIAVPPDGDHLGNSAFAGSAEASVAWREDEGPPPPCWDRAVAAAPGLVIVDRDRDCLACARGAACVGARTVAALVHGGRHLGFLGISTPPELAVDEEERSLITEVAGDLAFALDTIRRTKQWQDANERFRVSFARGAVGQAMTGLDGRFLRVNASLASMLGYSSVELEGMSLADVTHPDDRRGVELDAGAQARFERRYVTRGGATVWVDVSIGLVSDAAGAPQYHIGTFVDITERKRAEEQLRASQKLEAIGSLAGGVAHDFNNLLSVILSCTDFALEGVEAGGAVEGDLVEVKKAAERAAMLTRQLLAFSRKQVLQPVRLNLNVIVVGIQNMLRRLVGEDIEFTQVLAQDLNEVDADPGQIEQVLMNLVINARDAMPNGGKVTIVTSNVEVSEAQARRRGVVAPGSYVELAVTDTGSGMDADTASRLFEPFFTTKEKGKGTGLGLSTVYGIVRQSGGDIWVSTERGRGTTFRVQLPRRTAGAMDSPSSPPVISKRLKGAETILLVEDSEALRSVVQRTLATAGYTVLLAGDGEEALRISAAHGAPIHLLLTDVVMPRMNGRALAVELVKMRPKLQLVFMSGYTDDAIVHHGVLEAGTHFLGKPFTAADLTAKVRDVLDGVATIRPDRLLTLVPH